MRHLRVPALLPLLLALASCGDFDLGGPGDEPVTFSRGYAFIRDDALYVADRSDYENALRLSATGQVKEAALSPDGRVIVYVSATPSGLTSLRRINPDGGADSELVPITSGKNLSNPTLSRDAAQIAYISTESGKATLNLVNLNGSGNRQLGTSQSEFSPTFYADGASVLVASGGSALSVEELVRVDLATAHRETVMSGMEGMDPSVALSPDGTRAAYERSEGGRRRIYVINLTAGAGEVGEQHLLANMSGDMRWPTWISNAQVGYSGRASSGVWSIYEASAETGTYSLAVPAAQQGSYGGR